MLSLASALLVLAVADTTPVVAEQPFNVNTSCLTGSLQLCASVDVLVSPTPSGSATLLTLRIRNLEGTLGNGPWFLVGMGRVGAAATRTAASGPADAWLFEVRAASPGTITMNCDMPAPHTRRTIRVDAFMQTCFGAGWVEFSFNLQGFWLAAETDLSLDHINAGVLEEPLCETEMGVACTEEDSTNYTMSGALRNNVIGIKWHW